MTEKKLLSREPKPEMVEAVRLAMEQAGCSFSAEEARAVCDAIYSALPSLPEPGEVEQRIRFIANHLLPEGFVAYHDRIIEAADLIAALRAKQIVYSPDAQAMSDRVKKAEAECERLRECLEWIRTEMLGKVGSEHYISRIRAALDDAKGKP